MSSGIVLGSMILSLRTTAALVGIVLLVVSTSWAGDVCYDEQRYPSVVRLEKTESGFHAFLGGKFFHGLPNLSTERLTMTFTDKAGWQPDRPFPCRDSSECFPQKQGVPAIPAITLSKKEAIALDPDLRDAEAIEQNVSDWAEHDGFIWFGISFYSGEGVRGVGGIGRYDPQTRKMVIRRPKAVLDTSIDHIVHDGEWIWLGTAGHYECGGDPPTHGLLRYKWATKQIESFEGKDDGPCGFVVHDMLLERNSLWVATDLGLSHYDRRFKTWNHFVPSPTASLPMQPTSCAALYTELLKTLPHENIPSYNFSRQFSETLHRFRPRFLANYIQKSTPAELGCYELEMLAARIHDFKRLKTSLLIHHPVGSLNFRCILEAYKGKDAYNPELRDLLLSSLTKPADKYKPGDEETLYLLQHFPGDAKVAETLVTRLNTQDNPWLEANLLPSMLGSKSVPHLMKALDRFNDVKQHNLVMRSTVAALIESTGILISPNGVLASNSSPVPWNTPNVHPNFKDEALLSVATHWRKWWSVHRSEYESGASIPKPAQVEQGGINPGNHMEPRAILSEPISTLAIGTAATLTVTVTNLADPATPPIPNFPLTFQIMLGPHADLIKPFRGVTNSHGQLSFQYNGTGSGKDRIAITHEGDDIFMETGEAFITWYGPDLTIPLLIPPVLKTEGSHALFVTEQTQNNGNLPATPSTTHYFLSTTNPVNPSKGRLIGKRIVPALAPGERSQVWRQPFSLPSDLSAGTYYLAACADATDTVTETNEQNNCSFHQVSGQAVIIMPFGLSERAPQ